MGERHSSEPRAPIGRTEARRLTDDLRAAVADPRTSVLELTGRVDAAHRGRAWEALGHGSWGAYAMAELGVTRPTAYRLLDLTAVAEAVGATVEREVGVSAAHVWDDWPVLSVQAVVDLRGRLAELTDLLAERLDPLRPREGGAPPDPAQVGTAVADAVAELRERPDVPPADLRSVPGPDGCDVEAWRAVVAEGLHAQERVLDGFRDLGLLALRMAPGYLSDHDAEPVLHLLAKETGSTIEELLACRRYALTGDPRAIEGH
ncbi:hypothetical protein PUR71_29820 [Streptomyces sp. SP17BM10]|uniref:hypothetical protein n=1 Tax=Streptomyces sp. SP17BM10 TaxID=3002530 RepID=UPI002E794090|nr:hypothetical protein [Streptomyces sp. SP17BM10]MEE1787072.1 hypothetical protein [Streptomyces sp. SP17BM10]